MQIVEKFKFHFWFFPFCQFNIHSVSKVLLYFRYVHTSTSTWMILSGVSTDKIKTFKIWKLKTKLD